MRPVSSRASVSRRLSGSPSRRTRERGGCGRALSSAMRLCASCALTPNGSRTRCRARTCSIRVTRSDSSSSMTRGSGPSALGPSPCGERRASPTCGAPAAGAVTRRRARVSTRSAGVPEPACASSMRSPRPSADSRPMTASIAARFSATNSALLPCAVRVATRFAIVWLLPVPGGPIRTRCWPPMTASIAACCAESASRTRNSSRGSASSPAAGASAPTSKIDASSPAIAATTGCVCRRGACSATSRTIDSFA